MLNLEDMRMGIDAALLKFEPTHPADQVYEREVQHDGGEEEGDTSSESDSSTPSSDFDSDMVSDDESFGEMVSLPSPQLSRIHIFPY